MYITDVKKVPQYTMIQKDNFILSKFYLTRISDMITVKIIRKEILRANKQF